MSSTSRRRRTVALGMGMVLGAAGILYAAVGRGGEEEPRYVTEEVIRGQVASSVTATGSISPLVTVEVGSQVSGRIQELLADFNSPVEAGQVIARLDPRLVETEVARARANMQAARAGLRRAEAELEDVRKRHGRTTSLASQELIAQAEADAAEALLEGAEAQIESARAGVAQARAALDQAETNLAYTTIVSPIDGIVISRDVDVGQTVAASLQAPTLFTIAEDLANMEVHTNVAESDVGGIEAGMDVEFTVDAYPDKRFRGEVKEVRYAPQVVQNVVTYNAVVSVENPDGRLRPGMTADVTFIIEERSDVLLVPNAALRFRPPPEVMSAFEDAMRAPSGTGGGPGRKGGPAGGRQGSGAGRTAEEGDPGGRDAERSGPFDPASIRVVWRLGADDEPEPVRVRTGVTDGRNTEIVRGLQPGDRVIVGGGAGAVAPAGTPGRGGGLGRFM